MSDASERFAVVVVSSESGVRIDARGERGTWKCIDVAPRVGGSVFAIPGRDPVTRVEGDLLAQALRALADAIDRG